MTKQIPRSKCGVFDNVDYADIINTDIHLASCFQRNEKRGVMKYDKSDIAGGTEV